MQGVQCRVDVSSRDMGAQTIKVYEARFQLLHDPFNFGKLYHSRRLPRAPPWLSRLPAKTSALRTEALRIIQNGAFRQYSQP
jgi:hypothetical protein